MEDALTLTQKIYIAYYGRPADPAGLSYWANRIDSEGLEAVIEAFATSPESVALYGTETGEAETTELVTAVYQQLFSREPDAEGLAFYSERITSGEFTAATAMLDILNGARDTDLQVADNKLTVAQDFTDQVTDQNLAYSGEAAAGVGRLLLDQVSASPVQELETVTQLAVEVADLASTQTELVAELIPTDGEVGDLLESLPPEADAEDLLTLIEAVVTSALDDPSVLSSLIEAGGGSFASTLEALDDAGSLTEILNEADAGGATGLEDLLIDSGTGGGIALPVPPPGPTDTTAPTITAVSVPDAGSYGPGDTLEFTVQFSEPVTLTAGSSGTLDSSLGFTLDSRAGSSTGSNNSAAATYVSGNGSDSLTYRYTVVAGDQDSDGPSVTALALNGDSLADASGNDANLTLNDVASTTGVRVDSAAPTISSVSVADGNHGIGDTVVVTVTAGTDTEGNPETGLTLSGSFNGRTLTNINNDNTDGTYTGTYTVSGGDADVADTGTVTTALVLTDAAGNNSPPHTAVTLAGESITASASTVVFDLTSGLSSDHNSQAFVADVTYTIYIRMDSDSATVTLNSGERWTGANHLGADDQLILVGDGSAILGHLGNAISRGATVAGTGGGPRNTLWFTEPAGGAARAVTLDLGGEFTRRYSGANNSLDALDLWNGIAADLDQQPVLMALPGSVSLPTGEAPVIHSVSVADDTYVIGDTVRVTVMAGTDTAGNPETGLTLSGTFNGRELSDTTDNTDGTYTGTYTVEAGDPDVAAGETVNIALMLTNTDGIVSPIHNTLTLSGASIDANAPTLNNSSPVDDLIGVPVSQTIQLTFDSAIVLGSGSITLVNDDDNSANLVIDVENPSNQLSLNSDKTVLTINPTDDLALGSAYHLEIAATAITDEAGNPYAGISDADALNFATAAITDTTAPTIESVSAADGAYQFGDTVAVTITAGNNSEGNPETGLTLSGTFNGRELSDITANGDGTYTGTYTLEAGDDDVAAGGTVTTALVLRDLAGNDSDPLTAVTLSSGASITPSASTVVFDLTTGLSSDHNDQTFVDDVTYSLYIKVDSDSATVTLDSGERWAGADNLGTDDQVILVGDGSALIGNNGGTISQTTVVGVQNVWLTGSGLRSSAAFMAASGVFFRLHNGDDNFVNLWNGTATGFDPQPARIELPSGVNPPVGEAPVIRSISVADGAYTVGDTVEVTVTAAPDTEGSTVGSGLILSGTFNGQTLTNITDNTDGTYTGTYTVVAGDPDVADGGTVNAALVLTNADGLVSPTSTTVTLSGESIDTTAPTLESSSPADDATDVVSNANISLTFDSAIVLGSGSITLVNAADNSDSRTIDVTAHNGQLSINTSDNSQVLTINPSADLALDSAYHLEIAATAITDVVGNAYAGISNSETLNFVTGAAPDITAPTVTSVSVPAADSYGLGDTLEFTVQFSEPVTLTAGSSGTLDSSLGFTLDSRTGNNTAAATYASGSGSDSLTYRYTVVAGDLDNDGPSVTALALNGDSLADSSGNDANLTLNNIAAATGVRVDSAAPTITAVSVADGTHKIGDTVVVTVTAGPVGSPETGLTLSGTFNGQTLTNIDNSNTDGTYTGTYTVIEDDPDVADTGTVTTALVLTDAAGNDSPTHTEVTLAGESIDANAPTVTSVSVPAAGSYGLGDTLEFTVQFSEAVSLTAGSSGTLDSSLTLSLGSNTGGTSKTVEATYVSGSGSGSLIYRYTIVAGDLDSDGPSVGALALNGDSLADASGNDASLTLNNVSSTSGVLVDGVVPTIESVRVPAAGSYKLGDTLDFTVQFSETVSLTAADSSSSIASSLTLSLGSNTGGTSKTVEATYVSGSDSDSLIYRYTVAAGDLDNDGLSVGTLALNGDSLADASGNDATLTLNDVASTSGVLVDGVVPAIESVSVADGSYQLGDTVRVTVTAGNDTAGSPETGLTLSGTFNGQALTSIDNSNTDGTYTGTYTVTAGDADVADTGAVTTALVLTDAAGNASPAHTEVTLAGESIAASTGTVVFDLTTGLSSDHSSQTFAAGVTYTIYIKVDSDSETITLANDESWAGADNLGADDQIILAGDGSVIIGNQGNAVSRIAAFGGSVNGTIWHTQPAVGAARAATLNHDGDFVRRYSGANNMLELWNGVATDLDPQPALIALPSGVNPPVGLAPVIRSVSVADGTYGIGDTVEVTVTAVPDTEGSTVGSGLTLFGRFNGQILTNTMDNGDGTYTGTYTVIEGDADVAAGGTVTTDLVLTSADGNLNSPISTTVTLGDGSDGSGESSIDATAPTLLSSTPADDADDVALSSVLSLTFDGGIKLGSGGIRLVNANNPGDSRDIDVEAPGNQLSINSNGDGTVLTINPSADLVSDSAYHLEIDAGAITDLAGNAYAGISDTAALNFVTGAAPDITAPTVTSVSVPAADSYGLGDTLEFVVQFNEPVTLSVGSSGTLDSSLGFTLDSRAGSSNTAAATYASGSGSDSLIYRYTIVAGDMDSNGLSVGTLALNGDSLADSSGNAANLMLNGVASASGVRVDTVAPTIESVSVADGNYTIGDTVQVTVTAGNDSEGNPENGLTLSGSFNGQALTNPTDNGDGTYTGTYTVTAGDADVADTGTVTTALVLTDAAGNDSPTHAAVTLAGESITASTSTVVFDLTTGLSSGHSDRDFFADVTYTIYIKVDSDSHTLTLASGERWAGAANLGADDQIILVGDGSAIIGNAGNVIVATSGVNSISWLTTLNSAIAAGLNFDGDFLRQNSGADNGVDLWAGAAVDLGRQPAQIALPSGVNPPAGEAPVIRSVSVAEGTHNIGDAVAVLVTAAPVTRGDNAGSTVTGLTLSGDFNGQTLTNITDNGDGTYTGTYTVEAGDPDVAAGGTVTAALVLTDTAANLSSPISTTVTLGDGSDGSGESSIDASAPTVTRVSVPADGLYKIGDTLDYTVQFSEAITLTPGDNGNFSSTLRLTLDDGSSVRVDYLSATADSLTYRYTVGANRAESDGLNVAALNLDVDSLTDASGNDAALTLTNVADASGVQIDGVVPFLLTGDTSTVSSGTHQLGDRVLVTVSTGKGTSGVAETGLTLSGTFNGQELTNPTDNGDGTYTGTYTVTAGDPGIGRSGRVTTNITVTDAVGNVSSRVEDSIFLDSTTSISPGRGTVVFDLTTGLSSGHSDRAFFAGVSYTLYIKVDSDSATVTLADDERWAAANNLGMDDQLILVGDGSAILGQNASRPVSAVGDDGNRLAWQTSSSGPPLAASLGYDGAFNRQYDGASNTVDLWAETLAGISAQPVQIALPSGVNPPVGEAPVIRSVSVADGTYGVGAEVLVTVTAAPVTRGDNAGSPATGLTLSGTFNGRALTNIDNSNTDGTYTGTYTVLAGDADVAAGGTVTTALVLTTAANLSSPTSTTVTLGDGSDGSGESSIDTTAPTLLSSTPADGATDVAFDSNISLTFDSPIALGSGTITLVNDGDADDNQVINVENHSEQLSINGTALTINPSEGLAGSGAYHLEITAGAITDLAGNGYAGISTVTALNFTIAEIADTTPVVFDLTSGLTSDIDDQTFAADTTYVIYIRVDSNSRTVSLNGSERWSGANNLGADDQLTLVGDGSPILGITRVAVSRTTTEANRIRWRSSTSDAATLYYNGDFKRGYDGAAGNVVDLWNGGNLPSSISFQKPLSDVPAGVDLPL